MELGHKIAVVRTHLKLTQFELGEIVGLTSQQISNIENGKHKGHIVRDFLIETIKVSPEYMYGKNVGINQYGEDCQAIAQNLLKEKSGE